MSIPTPTGSTGQRLTCPECGKRGVTLRYAAHGEDHFACRYCDWSAYTTDNMSMDVTERLRLAKVNPDWVDAAFWIEHEGRDPY